MKKKRMYKLKPCPAIPKGKFYLITYNPCDRCDLDIVFKDKNFCDFKNFFEEVTSLGILK